ncbi:MAG: replication-associated recombination protein A [Candidatus Doudnabacteria bacterium]
MDLFDYQEDNNANTPLAERMRPQDLDYFVGQEEIVGRGKTLRRAIVADNLSSLIFWGPPGSGKTTLAKIIAHKTRANFVPFPAVTSSIKDLRGVIRKAKDDWKFRKGKTIVFVDEIHRFNKAQQDAFLPHVENGTITLIGATTENPSFEVINPLLSRSQVYILKPLSDANIKFILEQALCDKEKGLGIFKIKILPEALIYIVKEAQGDARIALNTLELSFKVATLKKGGVREINLKTVQNALQQKLLLYDKDGEEHYNIISALHKSLRDSDPQAGLYWLGRMLEAGEDPLYIARRLIRFASEDVGMADPHALLVAVAAKEACHFVGMPECELALAQTVVHLACAPKSNALYSAYQKVKKTIKDTGALAVPLMIRNAPTHLMKKWGYGKGYRYAHDFPGAEVSQQHLPDELVETIFYEPTDRGLEKNIKEKLNPEVKKF